MVAELNTKLLWDWVGDDVIEIVLRFICRAKKEGRTHGARVDHGPRVVFRQTSDPDIAVRYDTTWCSTLTCYALCAHELGTFVAGMLWDVW